MSRSGCRSPTPRSRSARGTGSGGWPATTCRGRSAVHPAAPRPCASARNSSAFPASLRSAWSTPLVLVRPHSVVGELAVLPLQTLHERKAPAGVLDLLIMLERPHVGDE